MTEGEFPVGIRITQEGTKVILTIDIGPLADAIIKRTLDMVDETEVEEKA